jgi:hypothetical protein
VEKLTMQALIYISFIFIPIILIWILLWAIDNEKYRRNPTILTTISNTNSSEFQNKNKNKALIDSILIIIIIIGFITNL